MTRNYLDILAETIRTNWDQPALTDFYLTEDGTAQDTSRGNHYTYGEMYTEVCRVADRLTSLGLQKGDHIAICGANSSHWVIAYLAIAKMQGVSVTVMHTLMPDEIVRLVNFSDAKALFTDPDIWTELSPVYRPSLGDSPSMYRPYMGDLSAVISLADWTLLSCGQSAVKHDTYTIDTRKIYDRYTLHSDTLTEGTQEEPNPLAHRPSLGDSPSMHRPYMGETNSPSLRELVSFPSFAPDDLVQICFTSGTSGKAKGVMLSYKNISVTTECVSKAYPPHRNKKILSYFPLAHAFGLGLEIVVPITRGCHIFLYRGELRAESLLRAIRRVKPYLAVMVPTMIEKLADAGTLKLLLFKLLGIDYIVVGGSGLRSKVGKKMKKFRIPIAPGYGMTETVALICLSIPSAYKAGTSGKVCDALTLRIADSGEILVKGENVMLGYYKAPEATAAKIDSDGWLHTGDKGHLDEDGYLYVEGRLEQDIIVLPNGENIRPDNIESLINALPEVKESIVLARKGNLVAIVIPKDLTVLTDPKDFRLSLLRAVNPQLPLFSQLYDVEITGTPLQRTEKQTLKRYLYS